MYLVGSGAGFSGDRVDAAEPVVRAIAQSGHPGAIVFETLGERTLALGQVAKQADKTKGYEPLLEDIITPILSECLQSGIVIVGNFGAANPPAAAQLIKRLASAQGYPDVKIAVITGDDIVNNIDLSSLDIWEGDTTLSVDKTNIVSANVYLGAEPIAKALQAGAQIVVAGRVADPALVLGPAMAHYGWAWDDWDRIAKMTLAGHLLECGAQVTGGYFADPGFKDVPDLARLGYPIAEISSTGEFIVTKPTDTGGAVTEQTVKEQILYEIHDPAEYLTPDVKLDITHVSVEQLGTNRVAVMGAVGRPRPDTLKTTVGFHGDWLGEGEISYAGPNAAARAQLAGQIVAERFRLRNIDVQCRFDLIGVGSVFYGNTDQLSRQTPLPSEGDVRLRVAVSSKAKHTIELALQEVMSLYCTGPAGGGGIRTRIQNRVHTVSYLIPRDQVTWDYYFI